jgi:hypothetical protein
MRARGERLDLGIRQEMEIGRETETGQDLGTRRGLRTVPEFETGQDLGRG